MLLYLACFVYSFPNLANLTRFPNLRLLDFRKIKRAHRKEAVELFKSKRGKDILKEIAKKTKSNGVAFGAGGTANGNANNEPQQLKRKCHVNDTV